MKPDQIKLIIDGEEVLYKRVIQDALQESIDKARAMQRKIWAEKDRTPPTPQWFKSAENLPALIPSRVIVKTWSGETYYAIYSAENEFDLHRPHNDDDHRPRWGKYSRTTVLEWKYLDTVS